MYFISTTLQPTPLHTLTPPPNPPINPHRPSLRIYTSTTPKSLSNPLAPRVRPSPMPKRSISDGFTKQPSVRPASASACEMDAANRSACETHDSTETNVFRWRRSGVVQESEGWRMEGGGVSGGSSRLENAESGAFTVLNLLHRSIFPIHTTSSANRFETFAAC